MKEKEEYLDSLGFIQNLYNDYVNLSTSEYLLHKVVNECTLDELKELIERKRRKRNGNEY